MASHTNVAYTAIRNELLYSGFVLPNVQIFFVQKISFATFVVSIDDFFTRYAGLGYSHLLILVVEASCLMNPTDATLASLSVLKYSRWRLRWPSVGLLRPI